MIHKGGKNHILITMDLPYAEAVAYRPRHHVLFFPNFAVKLFYESADDFPPLCGKNNFFIQ